MNKAICKHKDKKESKKAEGKTETKINVTKELILTRQHGAKFSAPCSSAELPPRKGPPATN
jgi:hypothetical protein